MLIGDDFGLRNFDFSLLFVFIGAQEGYRRLGLKKGGVV